MEPDTRQTEPLPRFEEIYPQHDFAPLVRLALTAAERMTRHLNKKPQPLTAAAPPRHLAP